MNRTGRWALTTAALSLALAACGSSGTKTGGSTSSSSGGATTSSAGGTPVEGTCAAASGDTTKFSGDITLAVNPWDGSAANANVAKIVLEKQGMKVKLLPIDENAVWAGLDSDKIDANLEVWPSGHASDIDTYIKTKKSVCDGGLIGPTGQIGWYIPKFVADAHPEYKSWEGLKAAAAAKYFATSESGDKGQFLVGDPSYVSYDADIITNLNLPFKVVVGGGEAALITGIDNAFRDKTPLLFYFYAPQWAQNKYQLVQVKLPDITPACDASRAGQGKDHKYACAYPTDHLLKAISTKLAAKSPAAYAFLLRMNWTSEDQNTVTGYKNADKMTDAAAAQKWVDANEAKWKAWLG